MALDTVIYAAIGGAIGGGLGSLIGKKFGNKNISTAIAAIMVVGMWQLFVGLYKGMVLPRIVPLDLTKMNSEAPVLPFIKIQSPEKYSQLIRSYDKAVRNNAVTQEFLNEFREPLFDALRERQITSTREPLELGTQVAIRQFEVYREMAPEICTQILHGRPFRDVSKILPEDLSKLEQEAMVSYFQHPERPESFETDITKGKEIIDGYVIDIVSELGITDMDPEISTPLKNPQDHQKICDFQVKLNNRIVTLEDPDFLYAWDYLLSLK